MPVRLPMLQSVKAKGASQASMQVFRKLGKQASLAMLNEEISETKGKSSNREKKSHDIGLYLWVILVALQSIVILFVLGQNILWVTGHYH